MELIIDIPEEVYRAYKMDSSLSLLNADQKSIAEGYLINGLINGTPLEKIRDEIKKERKVEHIPEDVEKWDYIRALDRTLSIIDKYKTESEESDADSDWYTRKRL